MGPRRDQDVSVPRSGRPCHGCGTSVEWSGSARSIRGRPGCSVAHVAAHELGAAAYAIKAARAAAPVGEADSAGRLECRWQREQLPDAIRDLILDDQRLRNEICWSVFDFFDSAAIVVARVAEPTEATRRSERLVAGEAGTGADVRT
jgi:immunity protein 5 of polymorphic toxin system